MLQNLKFRYIIVIVFINEEVFDIKILNITEPEGFFKALDKCEGEIFLISSDGDRINLKSKLCQYIALTSMFSEAKIDNLELEVSNPKDLPLIVDYLIRG